MATKQNIKLVGAILLIIGIIIIIGINIGTAKASSPGAWLGPETVRAASTLHRGASRAQVKAASEMKEVAAAHTGAVDVKSEA